MEEIAFDFGLRLRQLRTNKNWTQKQVADYIEVSKAAISAYENNTRNPTYIYIARLANLFHVSSDYLIGLQPRRSIFVDGLSEKEIEALNTIADGMRNKE